MSAPRVASPVVRTLSTCRAECPRSICATPPPLTVLAKDESDTPTQIAVTATHVLWTDARALYRIAKRGGNVETVRDSACDFTIRGDVVFFSNCVSPGSVWRLDLSDGKLSALATNLTSPRYPVTDGRGVYWITTGMYMHPFNDVLGCCAIWSFDL